MALRRRSRRRALVVAFLAGGVHAAAVGAFVADLGLPVDVLAGAPGGVAGAAVGLVSLAAVPTALALRHGLVLPLGAVGAGAAAAVSRTLTTPLPTYGTLGGHTVVSGPLYVGAYVDAWYVWLFVALVLGLVESVVRLDYGWSPPSRLEGWVARDRSTARRTAALVGVGHAAVFLALAADWHYFAPDAFFPAPWYVGAAVLAWTVVGLLVAGGVGPYLLVRLRLLSPALALAWFGWRVGLFQNLPLPDDPLPVYFVGWFFFAGVYAVVGGVEYALRRLGPAVRRRLSVG